MAGRFGSVVTAMVTPFRDDHAVDLDGAQSLASWLIDNGSDAIVVAGSTGESPTLTLQGEGRALPRGGRRDPGPRQADLRRRAPTRRPRPSSSRRRPRTPAPTASSSSPRTTTSRRSGASSRTSSAWPTPPSCRSSRTTSPAARRRGSSTTTLLQLAEQPNIVAVKDSTGDFQGDLPADRRGARGLRGLLGRRLGDLRVRVPGRGRRGERRGHLVGPQIRQMIDLIETGDVPAARKIHEGLTPAVQRAVRHLEPDPAEGGPRDGRAPGGTAAPAARSGQLGGTRPGPQSPGGRRSPLTRPPPRS